MIEYTKQRYYVSPWWNALMLEVSLSLCVTNNVVFSLQVYIGRNVTVIHLFALLRVYSCGFRQSKWIFWLFHRSQFRDLKGNEIFATVNNWACPNVQGVMSLQGKNPKLKIAGDNVNLGLCDSRDYFTSTLLISTKKINLHRDFWGRKSLISKNGVNFWNLVVEALDLKGILKIIH